MNKFAFSLVSLLVCFFGQEILAATVATSTALTSIATIKADEVAALSSATPFKVEEFKLRPRASLWGLTGNYTMGKGQVLMPFIGDQNGVFYGLVEGNIVAHDSTWLIGAGLGYRQIVDDRIYGGYLIADCNKSINDNSFWVANPGFEVLGKEWDFNVNAYVPFSNNKALGKEGWAADNFKNYDYLRFTGHNQYDHKRQEFEQAAYGADLKVGRVIPRFEKGKIYLGGYYFTTKDAGDVRGISAKLAYELNRYTALELTNTYDNYNHNKIMFGVRLTLGGYSSQEKKDFGLASRLLDPIDHGYSSTIVPIKKTYVDLGEFLQHDNIWFFRSSSQLQNSSLKNYKLYGVGTAENPLPFNKTSYDFVAANNIPGKIDAKPLLYFSSGAYSFTGFTGFDGVSSKFVLPTGWGMYGRSIDYKYSAVGAQRPVFVGGLDLGVTTGIGGSNIIDSMVVRETGVADDARQAVIRVINARDVKFNNVQVGANTFAAGGFYTGMWLSNAGINLYNTEINAVNDQDDGKPVYGIYDVGGSTINFVKGTNIVSATTIISNKYSGTGTMLIRGINAQDATTVNFIDGSNNVNATFIGDQHAKGRANSTGILSNNSTVNFAGGVNAISAYDASSMFGTVYGVQMASNSVTNFSGGINSISATVSSSTMGVVSGMTSHNSVINFKGGINTINVNNFAGKNSAMVANGIEAYSYSTINFLGGRNNIYVKAVSNKLAAPDGIVLADSIVNFIGGVNIIDVMTTFADQVLNTTRSMTSDIVSIRSVINFNGGVNILRAASYYANGSKFFNTYGIFAFDKSTVNFSSKKNKIEINAQGTATAVNGKYAVGMEVLDDGSLIQIGGVTLKPEQLSGVLDYVKAYYVSGSYFGPYKISWGYTEIPWNAAEDLKAENLK